MGFNCNNFSCARFIASFELFTVLACNFAIDERCSPQFLLSRWIDSHVFTCAKYLVFICKTQTFFFYLFDFFLNYVCLRIWHTCDATSKAWNPITRWIICTWDEIPKWKIETVDPRLEYEKEKKCVLCVNNSCKFEIVLKSSAQRKREKLQAAAAAAVKKGSKENSPTEIERNDGDDFRTHPTLCHRYSMAVRLCISMVTPPTVTIIFSLPFS